MKRLIFLFIAATFVACVMSSCVKEGFSERVLQNADGTCSVKLAVDMAAPVGDEASVKSAMLPEGESLRKVTNLNYYVFDSAGNFVSQTFYDGDLRNFHVDLPDYDGTYKVFFFANVGEFQIPENTKAEDMATACHYDYSTYSNYVSKIKSLGFPAALAVLEFNAKTAASISIIPLVYTLKVKINKDALSDFNNLTIKQIRVRQAARDIFPFSPASKLTQKFDERTGYEASDGCDYLSASDIDKLTSKENSVSLYVLENMRGELLAGNESWKNKIPANITSSNPGKNEDKNSTYIEISAEASTPTADYDNVIYRAYLGKSASNFDVQRNTVFTLTNNFTDDMVTEEDWRIEPGTPSITGSLEFRLAGNTAERNQWLRDTQHLQTYDNQFVNDPDYFAPTTKSVQSTGSNSFYLTDGFSRTFYIYRSNPNIKYNVTLSQSSSVRPYLSYSINRYDGNYDAITIFSTVEETYQDSKDSQGFNYLSNGHITGVTAFSDVPRKCYPVTITVASTDGLISDSMVCNYFYGKCAVALRSNEGLCACMGNPLELYYTFINDGIVGFYYNGIDKKINMKSDIGVDKEFLQYVGTYYGSLTGKYDSEDGNNQYAPYRVLQYEVNAHEWLVYATLAGFYAAPFTLGLSMLPFVGMYLNSEVGGTFHCWPPSTIYVPYRQPYFSALLRGAVFTTCCPESLSEAPSPQNWGNFSKTIDRWSHNCTLQDVLNTYQGKAGAIVGKNVDNGQKNYRYASPFCVENHTDMFLGKKEIWWNPPLIAISRQPGLFINTVTSEMRAMNLMNLCSNSAYQNLSKKYTQLAKESSRLYWVDEPFEYAGDSGSIFRIRFSNVIDYTDMPKVTSNSVPEILHDTGLLGTECSDEDVQSVATKYLKRYLRLPESCTISYSEKYRPKITVSGETMQIWDYLTNEKNHFGSYTLNDFRDYISE